MKVGLSYLAPHSALWWVRSSGSAALVCSSDSAALPLVRNSWSQLLPAGQLHTLRRWMNRNPSLSSAKNPCPSLWKSSKSECAFLPEGYSSNVSICSFKGIWGFLTGDKWKTACGNKREYSPEKHTLKPASFRNQLGLIYQASIPNKGGLVALNKCPISCC